MPDSMASPVAVALALVEALVVTGAREEMAPGLFVGALERDLFRFGTESTGPVAVALVEALVVAGAGEETAP